MTSLMNKDGESWQNKKIGELGAKTCFLYFFECSTQPRSNFFSYQLAAGLGTERLGADGIGNCPRPTIEFLVF